MVGEQSLRLPLLIYLRRAQARKWGNSKMHFVGPFLLMKYPAQANLFKRLTVFVLTDTRGRQQNIRSLWGKSERLTVQVVNWG